MKFTFLAHLFPATLLRASAAGAQQSPSAAALLASMRAKFNAVPLQTQTADNVTKFSRSFLQDIFSNVSPKLGRTLTRQMLAKQLKQTTKTQGGVSSASLIWHQNIQLASQGVNPILRDVIGVTSLENGMKINKYLVKTASPSSSGTLLPDHCSWVSVNRIERAGLLAVGLSAIVVLAAGCSSTGTGFSERLISPVSNNQQATNSENDSWCQPPRSPGFDPDRS